MSHVPNQGRPRPPNAPNAAPNAAPNGGNFHKPAHKPRANTGQTQIQPYSEEDAARIQTQLNRVLGPEYVSCRPGGGGQNVSYIEGWKALNLANEIFGFNGWSSELISVQVDYLDSHGSGRVSLGLSVVVRITIRDGTFHEDFGYGNIDNAKNKAMAFEKCKKEAFTDALKRCLRCFGNVLGNCLYDKGIVAKMQKVKLPALELEWDDFHRDPLVVKREVDRQRKAAEAVQHLIRPAHNNGATADTSGATSTAPEGSHLPRMNGNGGPSAPVRADQPNSAMTRDQRQETPPHANHHPQHQHQNTDSLHNSRVPSNAARNGQNAPNVQKPQNGQGDQNIQKAPPRPAGMEAVSDIGLNGRSGSGAGNVLTPSLVKEYELEDFDDSFVFSDDIPAEEDMADAQSKHDSTEPPADTPAALSPPEDVSCPAEKEPENMPGQVFFTSSKKALDVQTGTYQKEVPVYDHRFIAASVKRTVDPSKSTKIRRADLPTVYSPSQINASQAKSPAPHINIGKRPLGMPPGQRQPSKRLHKSVDESGDKENGGDAA